MSTEVYGDIIDERDPKAIQTRIMGKTQGGKLPAFWAPKRSVRNMPKGVRGWSIWDKKPELAIIVYDPALMEKGQIAIKYHDTTTVLMMLDDFARCGSVVIDKSQVTQVYTIRSPEQRDLHGHAHG